MENVLLLPKRGRLRLEQADAIRKMVFMFSLSEDAQTEIDNAIHQLTEQPDERWPFMKLSPTAFRAVLKATRNTKRPHLTWAVWSAAITYMRFDTGEILATRAQLALDANTAPQNVSTAMS